MSTYREPAPKERLPIERFPLASTSSWLWFVIIVVATVVFVLGYISSVHLECVRPAAGELARCTGASFNILVCDSTELTPFTLERDSIRVGRTSPNRRNSTFTAIDTNGGALSGAAVDTAFAQRTMREAERFREEPGTLEWRISYFTWRALIVVSLISAALIAFWSLYRRLDVLVLDLNRRHIRVRLTDWELDDIDDVKTRSLRGDATLMFCRQEEQFEVAWGQRGSIEAAADAITRGLEMQR